MNLERVQALVFPTVRQRYESKDSILYALGLGYGADPTDPRQLQFVYERAQKTVPSQCVVLGSMGLWMQQPELGIDFLRLLHGEHGYQVHRVLPPTGSVVATQHIEAVVDKGEGKGALVYVRKELHSEAGDALATIRQTLFLRGDGGCGSFGIPEPWVVPDAPQGSRVQDIDIATLPQLALIYRLSGDLNPLHADPQVAARAGFDRPILMGLCTMGLATRAALHGLCDDEPERLRGMAVRFSRPVVPGETLRFRFCAVGPNVATFSAHSLERDVTVLERCHASWDPA
jgi:acyl dehydratase